MPKTLTSRRHFLKTAAGAPLILSNLRAAPSANGKLNLAAVGVDGKGWSDLTSLASHPNVNVTAICDVDTARMAKAMAKFPNARAYQDWREMLETEGDKIDSVQVATPDNMHAPISIAAMERGKHVYCEKPLAHEVAETRAMVEAAAKARVVTQMGNQIQSTIEYRSAVALIQQGVIGKIKEVHAWSGASFPRKGRPPGADPIPKTLDWDKWLGVAPERPYKKGIYHPFQWRAWQDFGTGPLGDFMCHIMDSPFKALELTAPTSVKTTSVPDDWASSEAANKENWPAWATYEYLYPGTKWTVGNTIKAFGMTGAKSPRANSPGSPIKNKIFPAEAACSSGRAVTSCFLTLVVRSFCPTQKTTILNYPSSKTVTITLASSTPASAVARPPAISLSPAPSPRPPCLATSPTVIMVRSSSGTPPR
ncbi:Gfo/Idh/MocA family oxidoreductase [bacterium]|nr:Gfo/Idh/MocA family oxidoreductase [bacterium]